MSDVLLGIDAGTSTIKVCAFGLDGALRAKAQRAVPATTMSARRAEVDLEHYWQLLVEAIGDVVNKVGRVRAVGLAVTCPTTVLFDQDLAPTRRGILYLDRRGTGELNRAVAKLGGDDAYARCVGNRPSTSTGWAANLSWVKHNERDVWRRTRRVGVLSSFLGVRLTGRLAVDWTQASYSGLFPVAGATPQWDESLAEIWELPPELLPEILAPYACLGNVSRAASALTGLPAGIPVSVGAADTAAAAFAVGLADAGDAFESVGTSGVITFCLERPDFDDGFLNRWHVLPNRWLAHGAMSTLGGAFDWLKNKIWPEMEDLAQLERLAAQSAPGANGLVFLPYLAGERSPIWDADASGAWIGLRLDHGRADMVRAVFEGAAFGLRQILERAHAHWGWRPARLLGVGGGAGSRFWAQIKADVLDLDYAIAGMNDAAALGAAMMGGIAAALFDGPHDARLPRVVVAGKDIRPDAAAARIVYDKAFGVYKSLYPSLREAMHQLARRVETPEARVTTAALSGART